MTSTGTVRVPVSDEEEWGMGDGGALSPVSQLVSHALPYLNDDQTNTLRSAAALRT